MAISIATPTDQRSGSKPISFVLQNMGGFSDPVTLKIRPEDLTVNEPSRVAVHQTLGRNITGWVDNFGQGLPSVTIAGHTGWRASPSTGQDGVAAFEALNKMVMTDYHEQKQRAIDAGIDQSQVKLLFIDTLDNITWNVVPNVFVLRRSKSSPLLIRYQITLQAVSVDIDNPFQILPFIPDIPKGLTALNGVIGTLRSFSSKLQGLIAIAVGARDSIVQPIARDIAALHVSSTQIFSEVYGITSQVTGFVSGTANQAIGIAKDLAGVGVNIYRTMAAIEGIPREVKADIMRVGAAYNEVLCIFNNSLKQTKTYEDYTDLYGASNCSSTTGGRQPSIYAGDNVFELIRPPQSPYGLSSEAVTSVTAIKSSDPVLAPLSTAELARHAAVINSGISKP